MKDLLLWGMVAAGIVLLVLLAVIRRQRHSSGKQRIPARILEKKKEGETTVFLLETAEGTLRQTVPLAIYRAFQPGDQGELILWGKECVGFVKTP